jgi:hypothetical protein
MSNPECDKTFSPAWVQNSGPTFRDLLCHSDNMFLLLLFLFFVVVVSIIVAV